MDAESELLDDAPVRLVREDEPRPSSTRAHGGRARWWWAAVLVVALAVGGVVVADSRTRSAEAREVSGCEQHLRVATGWAERRLGLVTNYLQPTLTTSGRVQPLHLADLMSHRAGRVLPRVQRAARLCNRVSVRPWHFSLVRRQGVSAAYSAALVTLVQTVAAQGRLPFRDDATMQRLRDALGVDGG